MEVNVKVTVELGEKTVNLLQNLLVSGGGALAGKSFKPGGLPDHAKVNTEINEALAETNLFTQEAGEVEKPAKTRTRRTAAEIAAEKDAAEKDAAEKAAAEKAAAEKAAAKETAPEFGDLDEAAQLEAIKAEVTRHTKKGKSADIKALLAYFEAGRASELAAYQYPDFYDTVKRYGAGESVNDLTSLA